MICFQLFSEKKQVNYVQLYSLKIRKVDKPYFWNIPIIQYRFFLVCGSVKPLVQELMDGYQHRDLWRNMFRSCWNSSNFLQDIDGHRPLLVNYQCSSAVYSFISSQSHNGVWTKVMCVFRRNLAQALEQSPPEVITVFVTGSLRRRPTPGGASWGIPRHGREFRWVRKKAAVVVWLFSPARWMSWSPSRKPWCQPGTDGHPITGRITAVMARENDMGMGQKRLKNIYQA